MTAAGVGMSSTFDSGENVTLDVSTTALAKVGAGAGVQDGNAVAGAGATIGADGVKADYGASVGSYLAATANVAVGNDAASGGIGGSLIAPGSVGAEMGGEISCEDGKLSLGFNFMGAIGIGG